MADELVLIDLSSIAYPIWHMSQSDPDPNHASQQIAARVRALATNHAKMAICCDSGRSFRHDLDDSYKANRPEREAPLLHQIELAKEALAADGFPIWSVRGFEADDLIASATTRAIIGDPDTRVLIVSADKDLLQLVGDRVQALSVRDGSRIDAEAVQAKFGVRPEQMRDYLTLIGDSSDNVKGARGIGPKKAAALLAQFQTLDAVYEGLATKGGGLMGIPSAVSAALREFQAQMPTTRQLIALRNDVELPFDEIHQPRVPQSVAAFDDFAEEPEPEHEESVLQATPSVPHLVSSAPAPAAPSAALVTRESTLPAPIDWERGLDPRSMQEARQLAKDMYDSRMFSAYGTPQAVLSTVMVGRELGLPAMASLRSIHNIEGKHGLAASLMVALILKSGLAEYFEPVSFSEIEATYETLRKGGRHPIKLTHTIEMGRQAWPKSKPDWEKAFLASGWGKNPTDMLVARASARLARMVYPDLLAGLYTPEELIEIRMAQAA